MGSETENTTLSYTHGSSVSFAICLSRNASEVQLIACGYSDYIKDARSG